MREIIDHFTAELARRDPQRTVHSHHALMEGYSGCAVYLIWANEDREVTRSHFVLKVGPPVVIREEVLERRRFGMSPSGARGPTVIPRLQALRDISCCVPRSGCCPGDAADPDACGLDRVFEVGSWAYLVDFYIGANTLRDGRQWCTFLHVWQRFLTSPLLPDTTDQLVCYLDALFERYAPRGSRVEDRAGRCRLADVVLSPRWSDGIEAVLQTAAALCPAHADLAEVRGLWGDWCRTQYVIDGRGPLHGDLRFANTVVDLYHAGRTTLIDFGGIGVGHLFIDLARFELDLLLLVGAPGVGVGLSAHPWVATEAHRLAVLGAACCGPNWQVSDERWLLRDEDGRPVPAPAGLDNRLGLAWNRLRAYYRERWGMHGIDLSHLIRTYRFFLLGDCLRRLRWFVSDPDDMSLTRQWQQRRRLLLAAVGMLVESLRQQKSARGLPADSVTARHMRTHDRMRTEMGISDVFAPSPENRAAINEERNRAKKAALRSASNAAATIRLSAETGSSYFSFEGRFKQALEACLHNGCALRVLLVNPVFIEAHAISAAFRDSKSGELDPRFTDKHASSLISLRRLVEKYGARVDVRISLAGLPATMLLVGEHAFYEPYFWSDRRKRWLHRFDTFEWYFGGQTPGARRVRTLLESDFDQRFALADPLSRFDTLEPRYRGLMADIQTVRAST